MKPIALVVEDEQGLRTIYNNILSRSGFDVFEADNGQQAVAFLQSNTPTVIFLDMLMPKMGGKDVLNYITNTPSLHTCYVVIVSAHNAFEPLANLVPNGEFMLKPVLPDDIRRAARKSLDSGANR